MKKMIHSFSFRERIKSRKGGKKKGKNVIANFSDGTRKQNSSIGIKAAAAAAAAAAAVAAAAAAAVAAAATVGCKCIAVSSFCLLTRVQTKMTFPRRENKELGRKGKKR